MRAISAWRCIALFSLFVVFSGCGGGGGGGSDEGGNGSSSTASSSSSNLVPSISAQPQSVTVSDGAFADFSVSISSSTPASFQWRRNGQNIFGAVGSTYSINVVTLADQGSQFTVLITNSAGQTESGIATLVVNARAPQIIQQPTTQSVLAGASAVFTVTVNGSAPLTYQWRKNGVAVIGANSASYTVSNTSISDNGALFDVVIGNSAGTLTSVAAILSISPVPVPPTINTDLQDVVVTEGDVANLSVTASGTGSLTYQWLRNGNVIPGATTNAYQVSPATIANNNDSYQVNISNSVGAATSRLAHLTVMPPTGISLLAGTLGGIGNIDGIGNVARFNSAAGIVTDSSNNLYVADRQNHLIRKISPTGVVTTYAGQAGVSGYMDGASSVAQFTAPSDLAIDQADNLYVLDGVVIRKISPGGNVTTLAGSAEQYDYVDATGSAARFFGASSLCIDSNGNLFIADQSYQYGFLIRKISPTGVVTTVAGNSANSIIDGVGAAASFFSIRAMTVQSNGDLIVVDAQKIRRVTNNGTVTTWLGSNGYPQIIDGNSTTASFDTVGGIVSDASGNLYISDGSQSGGAVVRRITPSGDVTSLTSMYTSAPTPPGVIINRVGRIARDGAGYFYVSDSDGLGISVIRKITSSGSVSIFAGQVPGPKGHTDGAGSIASFTWVADLTSDAAGYVYFSDFVGTFENKIRRISPNGIVSTLSGFSPNAFFAPSALTLDPAGNIYLADNTVVSTITPAGISVIAGAYPFADYVDANGSAARFYTPAGIARDVAGNLYVTDSHDNLIRKVAPNGDVTTLAGSPQRLAGSSNGLGSAASFNHPHGLAIDQFGNLFVADTDNHLIRKITPTGLVSTVAGSPGVSGSLNGSGSAASFNSPNDLTVDASGNIYVADTGNHMIRKIDTTGLVSTIAGVPTSIGVKLGALPGSLSTPNSITMKNSASGTVLVVSDIGEDVLLEIFIP